MLIIRRRQGVHVIDETRDHLYPYGSGRLLGASQCGNSPEQGNQDEYCGIIGLDVPVDSYVAL